MKGNNGLEKEKDYLFLTHMIPKEIEVSVRNKSKNNMPDAANALQWHIYEGLTENLSEILYHKRIF